MNAPIKYIDTKWANHTVDTFLKRIEWYERTNTRKEAFLSVNVDPYTYGSGLGVRTYHPKPFPDWMLELKEYTENIANSRFDLCFLNRYDDQFQHLGWHADDSDSQDMDSPIVVQSFGAERDIFMRPNGGGPDTIERLRLQNGSTFIMLPGMQLTHQHRIPKHSAPCGVRVSLTWRKLKD